MLAEDALHEHAQLRRTFSRIVQSMVVRGHDRQSMSLTVVLVIPTFAFAKDKSKKRRRGRCSTDIFTGVRYFSRKHLTAFKTLALSLPDSRLTLFPAQTSELRYA